MVTNGTTEAHSRERNRRWTELSAVRYPTREQWIEAQQHVQWLYGQLKAQSLADGDGVLRDALKLIAAGPPGQLENSEVAAWAGWIASQALAARPAPEPAAVHPDTVRLDWLERQCEAYGFEDVHEGHKWVLDGPYMFARDAIDHGIATDEAMARSSTTKACEHCNGTRRVETELGRIKCPMCLPENGGAKL